MRRALVFALVVLSLVRGSARADEDAQRKEDARSHFEIGLAHFDREEYSAALAEFLKSRELFPTRSATKNAAICLRKEKRYDEALDMFEALLRDFSNLPPGDRDLAAKEITDLQGSVGSLEVRGATPGAALLVDGRARGTAPTPPLRVAAGSHIVRVYKEGFAPFEVRVDVAGRTMQAVDVRMVPLERSGKLRVTEASGKSVDVVVDNVVVGKTPWEGTLSVGSHVVLLQGEDLGTQPASAPIRDQDVTVLNLVAAPLEAAARITPTPSSATVAVDGVTVGRGVWEGKLRTGAHKIEIVADGFLPYTRSLVLERNQRQVLDVALERDLSSPMWAAARRPHFAFELAGGPLTGFVAGDVGGCSSPCGSPVPLGMTVSVRPGYEFPSGVAFHVDAGVLYLSQRVHDRATQVLPVGKAANPGTANDAIDTWGATIGLAAAYHTGTKLVTTFRFGAGTLIGATGDHRTGTFTNSAGQPYMVDVRDTRPTVLLYLAPEVRVGARFARRFEISAGIQAMFAAAVEPVRWGGGSKHPSVIASPNPANDRGDGLGEFPSETILGSTMVLFVPTAGLRVDL